MGQQQQLILVLCIVLVGTATFVGFRLVEMQNQNQARDQLMLQMNVFAGQVEAYVLKPKSLGGGGGSAKGFRLSLADAKSTIGKFTYTINSTKKGESVTFTGTGTVRGNNGKTNVRVTGKYMNGTFKMTVKN